MTDWSIIFTSVSARASRALICCSSAGISRPLKALNRSTSVSPLWAFGDRRLAFGWSAASNPSAERRRANADLGPLSPLGYQPVHGRLHGRAGHVMPDGHLARAAGQNPVEAPGRGFLIQPRGPEQ